MNENDLNEKNVNIEMDEDDEQKRPRPTREQWNRFNELNAMSHECSSEEQMNAWVGEVNSLIGACNWYTEVFEENGKKGMKNAVGDVIIPAAYDEFDFTYSHHFFEFPAIPALKNGKFGLVATDGSGQELTPFEYDWMDLYEFAPGYLVCKDRASKTFGIVTFKGKEVVPCNIEEIMAGLCGRIFYFRVGEHWGLWHTDEWKVFQPIYDKIEPTDMNEAVRFTLNGVPGYVKVDDESFIPESQKETMDEDEWDDLLMDCVVEWDGL